MLNNFLSASGHLPELLADGTYLCNINVANFGFKTGQYNIEAYLIDNTGTQYLLGSAVGYVED